MENQNVNLTITNADAQTEPVVAETAVVEAPVEKPKRKKQRSVEELENIAPAKMSPAELNSYIKFCREDRQRLEAKTTALENSAKSAFEQFKNADNNYKQLRTACDTILRTVENHTNCFHQTISLLAHKGVQG